MININISTTSLALDLHWEGLRPILAKMIINEPSLSLEQCEEIIKSTPKGLLEIESDLKSDGIITSLTKNSKNIECLGATPISEIFNYTKFSKKTTTKYGAYQLAENLKIPVCPYCNRIYTSTIITRKGVPIIRPVFDHYFSQEKHPLLALSFHNLIPCCTFCNSNLKGERELDLDRHIHPYIIDKLNDVNSFKFKYLLKTVKSVERIIIEDVTVHFLGAMPKKMKNTLDFFKVEDIYNAHKNIVEDMIELRDKISPKYIKSTMTQYPCLFGNERDILRLAFGIVGDENMYKHPLSKLRRDIAVLLGII